MGTIWLAIKLLFTQVHWLMGERVCAVVGHRKPSQVVPDGIVWWCSRCHLAFTR